VLSFSLFNATQQQPALRFGKTGNLLATPKRCCRVERRFDMKIRNSNISPTKAALFAALLSSSAMVAAQEASAPDPEIALPDPLPSNQPVVAEPPEVQTQDIVIPSTPPVAQPPVAPTEETAAAPIPAPQNERTATPATQSAQPKTNTRVTQRIAPVPVAETQSAVTTDTANAINVPESAPMAVPDYPEPVAIIPPSDAVSAEPVDNGNSEENWLIAAAGLGLLGAAGGAAVVAGKRRRRRHDARVVNPRIAPATAAARAPIVERVRPETTIEPQRTMVPVSVSPVSTTGTERLPAAVIYQRRVDPAFTSKVSGPPITDPLFSAKIDVPPVIDPLFRDHPDYVGPHTAQAEVNRMTKSELAQPQRSEPKPIVHEFAS
jgi:hypothetical protein